MIEISTWVAKAVAGASLPAAPLNPSSIDLSWMPLAQHWRAQSGLPIDPGWARVSWCPDGLAYDVVLVGKNQTNRAIRLNDRTWELGSVCEIFVGMEERDGYVEVHVTPENCRLQLRWSADGFENARRGLGSWSDFRISNPEWIASRVRVEREYWSVSAFLPVACLDSAARPLSAGTRLTTAVCRYNYGSSNEPIYSSTALLTHPLFHRPQEWHGLSLVA